MRKAVTVISLVLLSTNLNAAEWSGQYDVNTSVETSDNKRLRINDEESVSGAVISTSANIQARTERSETSARAQLSFKEFNRDDTLDSDDQYFNLSNRYSWETSNLNLNAIYRRENTIFSEIEDSGLVSGSEKDRRETIVLSPSFEYFFSERNQITVGVTYNDVSFPGSDPISLASYEYWSVNGSWTHNVSDRFAILSNIFYSDFESDNFNNMTESTGINLGFYYANSETLNTSFTAGYQNSQFEDSNSDLRSTGSENGYLFEFDLNKEFYTSNFNLSLSRSLNPSSSGVVNQRDELELNYRRDFKHNLFANTNHIWLENESLDSDLDRNDREYYQGRMEFGWQMTPRWSISSLYRYTWQEFDINDDSADDNTISLNLRYRSQRTPLSLF